MALDKETVLEIWNDTSRWTDDFKYVLDFAQAIYALGVADERARLAKMFDEAGWSPYAELVRKGE